MKQHITSDQLNELSEKQLKKLIAWVKGKRFLTNYNNTTGTCIDHDYWQGHTLLSIGKMMEFLEESEHFPVISKSNFMTSEVREWVSGWHLDFNQKEITSDELCDALWETVKEVLEGKK
jgi:hypothetical protein